MANYLGRNVNLALLVIIIGVVVALVGTTVFFQRGLQNRTTELDTTSGTLQTCQVALTNYQEKYAQAQQQVNETSQDIRKYDQLYEQKTGELKDVQGSLSDMTKQRDFEKLQKEKFRQFYEEAQRSAVQLNATVAALRSDINSLERQIDSCEEDLNTCEAG